MKTWFSMKAATAASPAEIDIFDDIGMWGVTAKDFIDKLRALDAKEITLNINSLGGSVFDGLAMYNALRASGATITVRVLGVAASAASFVAMAGDKIVMPENTFMMVHNPLTGIYGNAEDLREMADVLDKVGRSLVGTYVARTGKSEEEVAALLAAETYMTAAEAVELGFADELEPALRIAANFDEGRLPENVLAAFKPVAEAAPSVAEQIKAAMVEAGLEAHSATYVLAFTDLETAQAAIATAQEVQSLCQYAGMQDRADDFIKNRTSLTDVRAALLDAIAQVDEANQTDGHHPSDSTPRTEKPAASITTAGIWASRRNP